MNTMQNKKSPLAIVAGAALVTSLAISFTAQASENPFQANELTSGYQLADAHEGKCGEGKCGEKKAEEAKCGEGKCGEDKAKEGKCGEGKCGEDKAKEGKCGEGKCGEKK